MQAAPQQASSKQPSTGHAAHQATPPFLRLDQHPQHPGQHLSSLLPYQAAALVLLPQGRGACPRPSRLLLSPQLPLKAPPARLRPMSRMPGRRMCRHLPPRSPPGRRCLRPVHRVPPHPRRQQPRGHTDLSRPSLRPRHQPLLLHLLPPAHPQQQCVSPQALQQQAQAHPVRGPVAQEARPLGLPPPLLLCSRAHRHPLAAAAVAAAAAAVAPGTPQQRQPPLTQLRARPRAQAAPLAAGAQPLAQPPGSCTRPLLQHPCLLSVPHSASLMQLQRKSPSAWPQHQHQAQRPDLVSVMHSCSPCSKPLMHWVQLLQPSSAHKVALPHLLAPAAATAATV
jgi:hypothetical protein